MLLLRSIQATVQSYRFAVVAVFTAVCCCFFVVAVVAIAVALVVTGIGHHQTSTND